MDETINWTANFQMMGGPKIAASQKMQVNAYAKTAFDVKKGKGVEVQLGGAGPIQFLIVSASEHGDKLTYTVNGGANKFTLDAPLMLVGSSAVSHLDPALTKMHFQNDLDKDVTIEILAGCKSVTPDA